MVKVLEEGAGQGKSQHIPPACHNRDLVQGWERRAGVEDTKVNVEPARQEGWQTVPQSREPLLSPQPAIKVIFPRFFLFPSLGCISVSPSFGAGGETRPPLPL